MAKSSWHIVSFPGGKPSWSRFDGEKLTPEDQPAKGDGPVILLLPDHFFFFILATAPKTLRENRIHAGLKMRLQHTFPPAVHKQEQGSFRVTSNDVLGFSAHPALAEFAGKHRSLIDSADVVTTSFIISLAAARSGNLETWEWKNGAGPKALVKDGELQYFRAGEEELEKRKSVLEVDGPLPSLGLEDSLASLYREQVRPARLRMPLRTVSSSREFEPRFWGKAIAAAAVAGILFCLGQYLRLDSMENNVNVYEQSLERQYKSVLGDDIGNDPFGTLLFRLERQRGGGAAGLDVMGLLSILSENAPGSLRIEGLNYNGDNGNIRALIGNFDQLDAMLERLGRVEKYAFTLEQASNTSEGVLLNLNFTKR